MTALIEKIPRGNPAYQAYVLLRVGFTVAPILFGLDKFFNWMVDWTNYLAPWVNDIAPGSGQDFMYFVGAVEIAAGILVALAPRIGAYVVAAWLAGIVVNLLTVDPPTYYDIALRDFALLLAALTLGRLAQALPRRARRLGVSRGPASSRLTTAPQAVATLGGRPGGNSGSRERRPFELSGVASHARVWWGPSGSATSLPSQAAGLGQSGARTTPDRRTVKRTRLAPVRSSRRRDGRTSE